VKSKHDSMVKNLLIVFFQLIFLANGLAQEYMPANAPGAKNPILPGYFADPTIKKFGDIYYIYATTDNEMLASGVPTVWYSKDFQNWYNYTMEVPSLSAVNLRNFWAPDIIKGKEGKFYLYFGNCQAGCNIYGYVSDSPIGPWKKLNEDDTPVIAHHFPIKGFPSLDAQFFEDTDGKIYAYWGTWVHYNSGYAVGELDSNTMAGIKNAGNIPLEQTPNPFEAAYMMKKGDKYILMYSGGSCHDETYNVRYSYSDSPYGPFKSGTNNPILSTDNVRSVHGPGHHSILKEDGGYYIVYHRHDYPMTRGGLSRQVSIDKMIFENDSTIKKVVPTHEGISGLIQSDIPRNIAFKETTTASSHYHLKSLQYDYQYIPPFAVDDNNATMWKAGDNSFPQDLTIDLGKQQKIRRVMTQFEFASYYYQYKWEYSTNGKMWKLYSDRSDNKTPGSPMVDDNDVVARYLRLTVLGTEKTGLYAAVWNVKIYNSLFELPLQLESKQSSEGPGVPSQKKLLVALDAKEIKVQDSFTELPNDGSVGGIFIRNGEVFIETDNKGIRALNFVKGSLVLDLPVPKSLKWNGSYTLATWLKNPIADKEGECIASWCDRFKFGLANSYNALYYNTGNYGAAGHLDGHFDMKYNQVPSQNEWHHIVLTFDGIVEKIYVDGKLDNSQNMTLASQIDNAKIRIGASDVGENYSGYMASIRMYDYALNANQIKELMKDTELKE